MAPRQPAEHAAPLLAAYIGHLTWRLGHDDLALILTPSRAAKAFAALGKRHGFRHPILAWSRADTSQAFMQHSLLWEVS